MNKVKKYFLSKNNKKHGPFNFEELSEEEISPETLIWFEGLDDWKLAKDLNEMKPILELIPPPIPKIESNKKRYNLNDSSSKSTTKNQKSTNGEFKKASNGWIIFGFIFSFLGGLIGMGMGFHYALGKYDKDTKQIGWIMVVISFVFMIFWKSTSSLI